MAPITQSGTEVAAAELEAEVAESMNKLPTPYVRRGKLAVEV
jgi:hypothetical protein